MTKAKKKDLKTTVEEGIAAILDSTAEPSDGRLKALALGIKMCALNAKLEESEYGDFFNKADLDGSSEAKGGAASMGRQKQRKDQRESEIETLE